MQSKQLSTNDLTVFDLDAVLIIFVERGLQIHGIRPLNKLTAGDGGQIFDFLTYFEKLSRRSQSFAQRNFYRNR